MGLDPALLLRMKKKSASPKKAAPKTASAKKGASRKGPPETGLSALATSIREFFSSDPHDIVAAIKKDHEDLRNFLGLLKDTDQDMKDRRRAYAQFAALLKSHTTAEEQVVYARADKLTGRELHIKTAEGFVEHRLAEDLMKRIESCKKPLEWSAHANVISEIVEHHLKEEERDLLPLLDKKATREQNQTMLADYFTLRSRTQTRRTKENAGILA